MSDSVDQDRSTSKFIKKGISKKIRPDTFTNSASIPVDLARGDFVSAGLSALGVIPVVGEIGDTAKLAKMADKAGDAAKTLNKASDIGKNKWVSMSSGKRL